MSPPYDEELAASCRSQIQPTGSNPSLLPIYTIPYPPLFLIEYENAKRWHRIVGVVSCLTWERVKETQKKPVGVILLVASCRNQLEVLPR